MNKNCIRIAACALAGTFAFAGYHTSLYAKVNSTRILPAAGIAVVLEEGTTIQELTQEVIQNIAYLESASGIQSNIVAASEKASLSEETQTQSTVETTVIEEPAVAAAAEPTVAQTEERNTKLSAGFSAVDMYTVTETTEETSVEEQTTQEELETEETEEETTEESTTEEETTEEQDFRGLVIAKVNNYVNVRSIPSEEGEIVGKLYDKSVGEFEEEVDGWYKITSGNCTGYVKAEYCVTGDDAQELAKKVGTTYAIVNTTTLKVRKEANTDAAVLGLVPMEEELVVVEELEGWVKVAIEEGDGYVSREYVKLRTDFVHAESKEEEEARLAEEAKAREEALAAARAAEKAKADEAAKKNQAQQESTAQTQTQTQTPAPETQQTTEVAVSSGSEIGNAVISYATQFVGNPYVYGGTSLTNGIDCSGFVMKVYENFGVSLPHSSSALRSKGYDVGGLENAQPGDIVCYSGHVGLYVGNGKIVHASTSKTGIIVSNASYRQILTVRRIF